MLSYWWLLPFDLLWSVHADTSPILSPSQNPQQSSRVTFQGLRSSPSTSWSSSIAVSLADRTSPLLQVEACKLSWLVCFPPAIATSLSCGSPRSSVETQSSQSTSDSQGECSSQCQEYLTLKIVKELIEVLLSASRCACCLKSSSLASVSNSRRCFFFASSIWLWYFSVYITFVNC